MFVCIDGRSIEKRMHGISRCGWHMLRELVRLDRENQYLILTSRHFAGLPEETGRNVHTLRVDVSLRSVAEQLFLPSLLRRIRPDVYHAPHYTAPIVQPVPTIMSIYDMIQLIVPEGTTIAHQVYYRTIQRRAALQSVAILTCSENSKKDIHRWLRVPREKIVVAYPAVGDEFEPLPSEQARRIVERMGITRPFILAAGNDRPHKNLRAAVEAYALLDADLRANFALVIVGLEQSQISFPLEKGEIYACRGISDEALCALNSAASAMLFPSFYEGFGLPPLEAMKCGVPVVSSDASCLPEVLGDAAVYVNPNSPAEMASALAKILTDERSRSEMIRKGHVRVRRFGWEEMARKALELYRQAAGESKE